MKQNFTFDIELITKLGFLTFGGLLLNQNIQAKTPEKRPNVLILFSDQHSKNVTGFEGHKDVLTPNLDKLAKQSVVFDRAYCTVGISAPTRSSLMTGLYPRTLGLLSNSEKTSVMKEVVSMASLFQQNNYKTFAFGKRHTSAAVDAGWDLEQILY